MYALLQPSLERIRQHALLDQLLDRRQHRGSHRRAARMQPPQRRKILFESLEPRLLMSADLLPGVSPQAQDPLPPQVAVHLAAPSAGPQIRWTAALATGEAPLYASGLVGDFDLDNFSSPLAPVAPAGGLVYAGGVQGSLDVDGDIDTLSIPLDANQQFSLRLQPPAGLQARMEALDPNGVSLGAVEAANPGDALVLQLRTTAETGTYSIQVESLVGVGSYTVELFLNALLEEGDSADSSTAQSLDSAFSVLLDSPAERASVVGSLAGLLPPRTIAGQDFEDATAFDADLTDGVWTLSTTNPDAPVWRVTQSGEVGSQSYLEFRSDTDPEIIPVEVDDGEGGTFLQNQVLYEPAIVAATWRVNLAGVTSAVLEFDTGGYDPFSEYGYFGSFSGQAAFDGVALSTGNDQWVVLRSFDSVYEEGSDHITIDLVAAAAEFGLTLGADTLIRFQMFDEGGTFTESRYQPYRTLDNVLITTDQQEVLLTPLDTVASGVEGSEYTNPLYLLTDGIVPARSTDFNAASNVYWFGQEAGPVDIIATELAPAAGELSGLVFGLELDGVQRLTGLLLSVDSNDDYAVDYSLDGTNWTRLVDIAATQGSSDYGMDTFRISEPTPDNAGEPSFSPVQARYLRVYATGGDGAYALGEVQAFVDGSSDEADYYSVTLAEGELATFTLGLEHPLDRAGTGLQLLDADGNLLTDSLPGTGAAAASIENFRAPAAGTYTVRVFGNTSGDYHLSAVKGAQFGPASGGTLDLTLTPIVLDAFANAVDTSDIRVGVVGGGVSVDQLADDTYFDFSPSYINYYDIDTPQELANFDVIVLGNYIDPYNFSSFAPALREWVESGHGVVTTGWMHYYASLQYGSVNADMDAIIPINLNTYTGYQYGLPTIDVADTAHPVTDGIADFSADYSSYYVFGYDGIDANAQLLGSAFGYPAIVVAEPGAGRTVSLSPTYSETSALYYGSGDRLLEQAVAWAAKADNLYSVQALAGTPLTITLDLLGSDLGEPSNTLLPTLEIFDATGTTLLASGTTFASIDVLADATFRIRVSGVGAGDYLLRAGGEFPPVDTPVEVVSSSLDDVDATSDFPNEVDLHFSEPLLYTSLEAGDLLVNGVAATGLTILSPTHLRFNFSDPVDGDGLYTAELAAGSITDIHGNSSAFWSRSFALDTVAPTVVGGNLAEGAVFEPGSQSISLVLSEDIDTSELDSEDVWLRNVHTGQYFNLNNFFYDGGSRTLSITTPTLTEGNYEITLRSDFYGFKDHVGNLLDGDADGVGGDYFTRGFSVDSSAAAAPALSAQAPAGSLVYSADITDHALHAVGDTDSYTFTLAPGQTLSLMASQTTGAVRIALELFDATTGGNSLGLFEASSLGQTALLQTLAIGGGNYRVEVRSLEGSGSYRLQAVLNAALETEAATGIANDTLATAQDLSNSLLVTGSDRAAVLGLNTAGAQDWYQLHLDADQLASFLLTPSGSLASSDMGLELYDAAGVLLTAGGDTASAVDESIIDFRAPTGGDYFLRVTGHAPGSYSLVATRDQSFSLEQRNGVQDISATGEVLGALGSGGGNGSVAVVLAPGNNTGLQSIVAQLNDQNYATNQAVLVSAADVDTLAELSQYSAVLIGGTGNYSNQFFGFAANLRAYVEAGGGLIVTGWGIYASGGLSGQTDADFDAIVPVNTTGYDYFYYPTITPVSGHPITDGVASFSGFEYSEFPAYSPQLDAGATLLATANGTPVAAAMEVGKGRSVYIGPIYAGYSGYNVSSLRSGEADQLLEQAVAWAAGDMEDTYQVAVQAGDALSIQTTTPLDGAGAPGNALDVRVELLDPAGVVVASASSGAADGRNVLLTHDALSSGNYTVRVLGENTSQRGEYVLRVSGATGSSSPAPIVVQTNPVDGKRLAAAPTSLSFDLSHTVLATSLSASDLSIDGGGTVTGVEMVDGDTVRFLVSVPDTGGTYQYSLLAGAFTGLQGGLSLAHTGSFTIDKTAPRIVAQAPEVQSLSPFNTWSVTFSEAVDPATVQTSDFVLRNPANNTIFINSATVSGDGLTVTLSFSNQFAQGYYQLTAGPNIQDLAGNRMDQDAATEGEQTYLGSVQIASPDLTPIAISITLPDGSPIPEGGAALGSQVRINWTVRNDGSDAARNGYWYDQLYLSTDTGIGSDISLGAFEVQNPTGLAAGAQYAMSALVNLPLNDSVVAGTYYIRVQADTYNYQPENAEGNNNLFSEAFTTLVPPLPDLTVSNVVAPEVIEAGKTVTVSWTVNNIGGAAAVGNGGYWYDRVLLSQDTVAGNGDDVYLNENYFFQTIQPGQSVERSLSVTIPTDRTGTWYVLVKADQYNYVYERTNESNNAGFTAAAVQVIIPTEDLTPVSLTAPDAAVFGSTIDVAWTVRNDGTGPTYGNWYDYLWLSKDSVLGGDDIALRYVYASDSPDVRPVAAGAEYTRNIQGIQLPLNVSLEGGNYFLLLKTDAGNQEPELSESNNLISRAISLSVPAHADLTVSDVTLPAEVVSGQAFDVHFTLNNIGSAAANNFNSRIYLSSDGVSLSHHVGDYTLTQALAAGGSVQVTQSIAVPLYSPGPWYVVVVADNPGSVYEHAGEGNNLGVSATPVQANLPPLPDLVASNLVAPLEGLAGETITFSWTITNAGTGDFSGTWHDRVYLVDDNGNQRQNFGTFSFEGTLAVGASVTRTQNLTLAATQDGTRRFVVVTDAFNQVNETPSGQLNNQTPDDNPLTITFPPLPNLQVTAITPPDEPFSGTQPTISWVVSNVGTGATSAGNWYDQVILSLDDQWSTTEDNIHLATVLNPNYLPAGESYQNSATIAIPRGLFGDYHFLVRTDVYGSVFEDDFEGDNTRVSDAVLIQLTPPPDLRVDVVEAPNEEFSGTPITLSWTVRNHGEGPTAEASWYDRVIMSEDAVLGGADDRRLGDVLHAGRLSPSDPDSTDDSYSVTHTFNLPIGVVGNFHFFVITDVANHVYEHGSENNNTGVDMLTDGTGPEPTTILLTPPPDLEVYSVSVPGNVEAGHVYNATWRVVNFGSTPTPNTSWTDRLYLSADGVLDAGDIFLRDVGHSGALGVVEFDDDGEFSAGYYDATASFTLPFAIAGNYQLIVKTDIANQVFEGFVNESGPDGEDNNQSASNTMAVVDKPADLVVENLLTPATGEAGKQISLTWTVRNTGTGDTVATNWLDQVRLSLDDILFDDDDVLLENVFHNGLLAPGGSYTHTESVSLPFSLTGGSYRLYVLSDINARVTESSDANNTAYATIQIVRDTPDLQVTTVGHEASGMAGLPLDVSWHVENTGINQTDAGNWYDEVYLSLDEVLDNSDTYLGYRYRNALLAAGAGYDASGSFTLPGTLAPNDYFVIVRTDRGNAVTEGAEGELNNTQVSTTTVPVVAFDPNNPEGVLPVELLRPDLKVTAIDAPDAAISGQMMSITWTVTNDSTDPTGNRGWYDAIYLSRDGVLDRNADLYLGYAYQSNLAAGASYTQVLDVRVPYGQSGPFYLFVATDSGGYITESNELNNAAQDLAFTQVALAPPADLVVGDIDIPVNGVPGQLATITFSVNNQGTNPALGSWTDSVYLSTDDTWDINDALFGVATHHGDVAGGASYSSTLTATLPGLTPGSYKVIVRSDIRNHIPESNEGNNIQGSLDSVALDVEALVFNAGLATDTGNLGQGQAVYYKFDVAAGETVRLSLDGAGDGFNANELYVRRGSMPSRGQFDLASHDGFETDPSLTIPTTEAGTYYVLAYGQSVGGSPAYTIKAEIIPFSITAVSANEVGNSGNVTLRIEGAKFGDNTEFSLVAPDGTVITAHAVYLDNSSEAYATFSLLGAAIGSYDVRAEQISVQADGTRLVLATETKLDAINVSEDFEAAVYMTITGPTDVMVNRTAIFTLNYVNEGGADSDVPLMVVESFSATPMGLSASDLHTTPLYIMAANFDGPMDTLRPGARYGVPIVFKSGANAGNLDIRVGRILTTDTRLITDWSAIEAGARPTGVDDTEWSTFWDRVQPLIGLTWGEYVQLLDRMMVLVSEPGNPVRDVREIFSRMLELNPDYVPYNTLSGEVRDAGNDTGLADVQMAAYLLKADGSLEYKASALSDADGHFTFARLEPGQYSVVAIGKALDMDRDGQLDLTVPSVTLGHTSPGEAGVIYIQPSADSGVTTDSNPSLNRDANGVTHMVWTRGGQVWHAWFDTTSGTWKDAQALSSEDGYGPVITSSDKLFDGTTAGTIVAWQQGKGNDANIWYAVARAKTGGGFEWSLPRQLTDIDPARDPADDVLDGAVQIIVGDSGTVMFTYIKRDAGVQGDGTGVQDDSDLYFEIWAFGEDEFTWPAPAETVVAAAADGDTALEPEGVSLAYGRQWKFGPWDAFGGSAELVLALNGTISENNCKVTLGAQGQIQGSVKGSNIRSTVSGNGAVTAEWGVNQAAKDWMFNGAKGSVGANVQFDWRYGLSTLLSKIPHPAVTAAHLAYSLAVGLGSRLGLEFEDGITFGGGINIAVMEWKMIQPFPEFVRPDGIFEVDLSGTFGLYAQLDVGPTGDSFRVQGDITVTVGIEPVLKIKSVTGNITFSGNIGWMPFNEVFSVTLYNNEGTEIIDADAQTQDVYLPIFDADALIGTGLAYGDNHVLADVSQDVTSDSAMTLAKDDGVIFGAWTHMAETRPDQAGWLGQIGWEVMVAEYGAGWGTPVALPGSLGVNAEATAVVDGNGQRMVLWTHAASPVSATPSLEDLESAMDANNLVYALYDEGTDTWGPMQTLAATTGMDSGIAFSHNAAGQLVVSWVYRGADALDHLMTATWNGAAWSAASEVAFGASMMDPAMERLGDDLIVVWEVDANPEPEETEKSLFYSIYDGTSWSAGAMFDPIAMATGMALSAGLPQATTADEDLSLMSGFPPFPVPEECLKCKPEEIKRIRESAPNCIDGGGTQVTFDDKTCTEKTIVYRPCVVRPRDPNDIIGPEGYGEEDWISSKGAMEYMIRFENAADASAPAQRVVITQQLDADLDWRTFRIDDFGFGDQIIDLDGKSAFYQKRLDYTADPTRGFFLDVTASVDVTTGIVTWTMTTIDPATGDLPQEASIGFLPVNDTVYDANHDVVVQGTGKGEGYVTYTVRAKSASPTGTVVDAQARIIFDTEEPIDTPAIFNTLDAGVPTSQVISFANSTTADGEFLVQWTGEDDEAGSGLRDFSIYVSIDGSDFEIWLPDTTLTEAIYIGSQGHTYRFFSTVRDWAGNEEVESGVADATITVTGATGSLSGTKFEDFDGDGVRDAGETGLAGWTIYLDADDDSVLDAGEVSTITLEDGSYSFADLDPGAYTVREVAQAGWLQTTPGAAGQIANVVSGETTTGIDFGNFALAQIGGQVFSDTNANGVLDDGETGLAGWTLTLDQGSNGSVDATTTTDEYGFYRFTGVGPGVYTVLQVPQAGWLQTGPAGGSHSAQPTSGEDIGSKDFANVAAARISGTKFEDVNGNGQRDVDEQGLSGWTIFLDGNANGVLDAGERSVVTGSDGAYSFSDLLPGNYVVAEVMQDGWVQTSPGTGPSSSASSITLSLSGMDVVLSLPEDVVAEGDISVQADSANELASALVGLDAFRADPRFAGITGAGVATVIIDTGIDLNHSWFGPDADLNGVADRIVYSYDFADGDADASDRNGHGSHIASLVGGQDATYGGVAPGADIIALKVFEDGGAGYFSYLEAALQWVVLNADAYDIGVVNLSLGDGGNWDDAISRYGLGDELAALAGRNILLTAASGNNYFQYSGQMGVAYPAADPAVLAVGAVWSGSFGGPINYANGAIDYSTGADVLAAFGQRDDQLLDVLAPGTRMVGANYNGGTRTMFGTSQASAYLAGVATLAQDLALDHLGRKLSLAEFSTLLASTSVQVNDGDDENDNVINTGLDFARVDLLALAEGILAMEAPDTSTGGGSTTTTGEAHPLAAPGVHQFSLAAGEQHTGADFGNFALGRISGTVFDDRNADAAQTGTETGLGGWTVFLDGNANGSLDVDESSTLTLGDGSYQFNGIGPGSYQIRLVGQDGWTLTTGAVVAFPMTSGLQADADFGVNATPTLAAIDDLTVDEGGSVALLASGADAVGDTLAYSLVGETHGATIDAATGAFHWDALDGNASAGFTLRVTDGAGGIAERSFTVTVANVVPTLTLSGAASVTDDQDFVLDLDSSDPGQDTLSGWLILWGDGSSSPLDAAAGSLAHRYAAPGDYTVQATATDEDGSYSTSTTVTVLPGTLKVTGLTATDTGFQVRFNRAFVPDTLNLYDSSFYNRGAADLALRDASGRVIAGSVVLDDDRQGLSFVRTGGLLANGSYTVTLDSRANAFVTAQGGLLDGNRDGTAGDNYTGSFSVNGSGAVLRIGEFSRGPGQAADVPATAMGVPITLSGATGARAVSFTLAYDPALLHITGVSGGAGIPAGSTVSADFSTPGQVHITLALGDALGAGGLELVRLTAQVPGSAPYGAKQVLDLRDITLDTGAAVRDDDGLHLVAYVGDASGNAKYSTLDVQRIQRAVLRMDSGFGAYPLIDPVVVADINGNGALSSLDAQRVLSEVMGLDRAEIPAIPPGMTLTFSGPDPVVSAATVAGQPGETVVVPITLDTAAGLESVEITLVYPADSLRLLDVRRGGLTQDFDYFVADTGTPGRIVIDMARMNAMTGGAGTLVELAFQIADDAQGSLAIDLQATALNETRLTLNAESQPGQDPTDGRIVLPVAQTPVVVVATPAAAALPVFDPSGVDAAAPVVTQTALPSYEIAPPTIQFQQPVSDFAPGTTRPASGWVGEWLSGGRQDKTPSGLKLNNWKLSAPVARNS